MNQHKLPVDPARLETLPGKGRDEQAKTFQGKEYPSRLNEAFAELHVSAWAARFDREAAMPTGSSVDAAFDELYAGDVDFQTQQMRPDCDGHRSFVRATF